MSKIYKKYYKWYEKRNEEHSPHYWVKHIKVIILNNNGKFKNLEQELNLKKNYCCHEGGVGGGGRERVDPLQKIKEMWRLKWKCEPPH